VNIGNMQSLVDYYAGQDKLATVDGGRDPEAVAADLRKAVEG
jgi:adenylate kinase family enzyme